ncbi:MAG: SUMF1/EgtB/PvdO family nonheme iron enzyme [Sphaerochaetaceae bacterium]|nr:SUMF1/EgtB/PvdO family nonheme iron enzyme [Sphaerochaetaceae bacterium]
MKKCPLILFILLLCFVSCTLEPSDNVHEWDNGVVTQDSTCVSTGLMMYSCSFCNATKVETIPVGDNHNYTKTLWSVSLGFCEVCEDCNDINTISSDGIKNGNTITKLYVSEDVKTITKDFTSYLGDLEEIVLPKTIESISEDAFCNNHKLSTITYEGTKTDWEKINLASGWNNGLSFIAAQCSDGKTCYNCIHKLTEHDAKAKTSTSDGNIHYWQCDYCDTVFTDSNGNTTLKGIEETILHNYVYKHGTLKHYQECTVCHVTTDKVSHSLVGGTCLCGYASPNSMVDLSSISGAPSVMVSNTELTYEKWYDVRVWAENNGYSFGNKGKEGNSGIEGAAPTDAKNQPVSGINWRDAIIWCNAYSEKEGLVPVYYTDADYNTPLRTSTNDVNLPSDQVVPGTQDCPYICSSTTGNLDISKCTSTGYRLPTVDEFKKVQAAGETFTYAGSNTIDDVCWYYGNSGQGAKLTQEVATLQANKWGLFDCSGNVWEWCFDWENSGSTTNKVIGGGSVETNADKCESGKIGESTPNLNNSTYGLRIYRSVFPTT